MHKRINLIKLLNISFIKLLNSKTLNLTYLITELYFSIIYKINIKSMEKFSYLLII